MTYLKSWLVAFALTFVVEAPIVAWFYRKAEPSLDRRLALIFFANLATHPAVWFMFTRLPFPYVQQVVLAEIWAFGLEILYYALVFPGDRARAVAASITANTASLAFGFAWLHWFGAF